MSNFNSYYNSEIIRQVISVVVLNEHNVLSPVVTIVILEYGLSSIGATVKESIL